MEDTRTPDELLRQAVAIRSLLDDADPGDHRARIRLVASMDGVHVAAARQWRAHGWRPITESVSPARGPRTLLLPPLLATVAAALLARSLLGVGTGLLLPLVTVGAVPFVLERRRAADRTIRRASAGAVAVLALLLTTATMPTVALFVPAVVLLSATALLGTVPRPRRPRWSELP